MAIDLSILICSTHTRYQTFGPAIQNQIWPQYQTLTPEDQARVEIMMLTDNKQKMLGEKRNVMVDAAQGKYVVFVDDDDRIEPHYIETLLDATRSDADVITFKASVSINNQPPKPCRYSIRYSHDRNTATEYHRIPNHICCVKKTVGVKASFPNVVYGEDSGYSKLLLPHLKTEHHIDQVLYHYDYNDTTSETQYAKPARIRVRKQPPVVDVVILSNAKTSSLRRMTQTTIDTCVAGANSLPVNVIVMEQQPVTYHNATTVQAPRDFHYNKFANLGARQGAAEWIMIANNDLVFHDGWLHQLIAAQHPLVSPKCPDDRRQTDIIENTVGDRTGRHMSGWCYMITRDLWSRIGGFDEDFDWWCADDSVIEQCRSLGVLPMLVPLSVVTHLGSVTGGSGHGDGQRTWGNIRRFSLKYGPHRFVGRADYQVWLRKQEALEPAER